MNLTEYQHQILGLLGLAGNWATAKTNEDRAKVWDKAQRQLWATPQSFVDGVAAIADRKITVDLCAEKHTAKASRFFGPGSRICINAFVAARYVEPTDVWWCNPDFLRKDEWAVFVRDHLAASGFLIVPPSTDQPWFGDLHENPCCYLTVLEGRMRFEPPEGVKATSPNGGTVLWQVNFDRPVLPPRLNWREVCEIGKAVAA